MVNNFIRKFISKKLFIKSSEIIIKETIEKNKAKLVISSSLHGIILAETYGIPAILLMDKVTNNMFKYNNYYYNSYSYNHSII